MAGSKDDRLQPPVKAWTACPRVALTSRGADAKGLWLCRGVRVADLGDREQLRAALAVASVGIELGVAISVGWFVGDRLDGWLGTGPWMTVVWIGLGAAAGFRSVWRTARRYWPRDPGDSA